MLKVISDGLFILWTYKEATLLFMVAVVGLGYVSSKNLMDNVEDLAPIYISNIGVGVILLSVLSYAMVIIGHFVPLLLSVGSFLILLFAGFAISWGIRFNKIKFSYKTDLMFFFVLILGLILRLSFLRSIILPPYSDSPIHYQIVSSFIHPQLSEKIRLSLSNIGSTYYHFGFHSLAAWLSIVSGISIENSISLLGQLILVVLPFSMVALVYALTENFPAAFYAGLLSAVGWPMPAFAVNWGKYPALSAIALAPALISHVVFWRKGKKNPGTYLWFALLLLGGIALLHTRILICLLLLLITYLVLAKIRFDQGITFWQAVRFSLMYIISSFPLYQLITDFYSGPFVWLILGMLLPFAFYAYPKIGIGVFLYTLSTWAVLIVPIFLPANFPEFLDKQFIGIYLYIPFSILGGIGFAGLLKSVDSLKPLSKKLILLLPIVVVIINAALYYSFSPNLCCNYFHTDDRNAFDWIKQNSVPNSLFLISSFDDSGKGIGTDAGIWISPLAGRPVNKLPYTFDWNSKEEIEKICQSGAKNIYIYAGDSESSFVVHPKSANSLQAEFRSGDVVIYQLTGCPP